MVGVERSPHPSARSVSPRRTALANVRRFFDWTSRHLRRTSSVRGLPRLPQSEEAMKISAMNTSFGARVEEVDLASLTQRDTDLLRAALLEHGLLAIRNQELSPVDQVMMSEVFAALETFPSGEGQLADFPQIFRVASRPSNGHTNVGRYWHSDGSFRAQATPIS